MPAVVRLLPTIALLAACGGGSGARPTRPQPADQPTVSAADLETQPSEPIEKVLQRKSPGLLVSRTSSGELVIQIRGSSAFNEKKTPPLFVLDDVPFNPGPDGALSGINPYDIESIKILRGAEAGLYGIDGGNGVIVIKTKRAGKR